MATIGFIGLGIMGAHMARNLKKAGHALVLNGAYPVPDDLRSLGKVVASSTEVARASEIIILMVPDTPDVANVLFAEDGVAKGIEKRLLSLLELARFGLHAHHHFHAGHHQFTQGFQLHVELVHALHGRLVAL